jgi:hypothetical protein
LWQKQQRSRNDTQQLEQGISLRALGRDERMLDAKDTARNLAFAGPAGVFKDGRE